MPRVLSLSPFPPQPPPGVGQQAGEAHPQAAEGQQEDPPVAPGEPAHAKQYLRRKGQGLSGLLEDLGEAGNDVVQQHHDGGGPHQGQQGRVDEGGDQVAPQLVGRLLELDQALQHQGEGAAGFSGPHHVDVELGEDPRVGGQAVGQGPAPLEVLQDLVGQGLQLLLGGELLADGQATVQRQAGADQGGELLGEEHEVPGADAARAPANLHVPDAPAAPRPQMEGDQPHVLQLEGGGPVAGFLHHAVDDPAVLADSSIEEGRHVCFYSHRCTGCTGLFVPNRLDCGLRPGLPG